MTSKTSCFERAIFLRSLKKVALAAVAYTLLWLLILPLTLPGVYERALRSSDAVMEWSLGGAILNNAGAMAGALTFVYGLVLAWLVFFWLFRTNSAYHLASLPVKRETLFATNFFTGLLAFLAPHALVALVTFIVTAAMGAPLAVECLQWFAVVSLDCLFFYSFAVLLVMVVGQVAAMPVVYVILNLTVYAVHLVVSRLMKTFVYGMPQRMEGSGEIACLFSPLWALINERGPHMEHALIYDEALGYYKSGAPYLANWQYALVLGAVGVVFAVLAFFLLRRREMERCGDVIAVRWLRPVFLYTFTIGCALIIGEVIMEMISGSAVSSNFILVMLFLFIGAFIGFFAAQMLLKKTVHVFKTGWLGLGVCCLALLAVFGAAQFDLTGYSRRIPARDEIASVSVEFGPYSAGLHNTDDAQAIADTLALHENILENRTEQERLLRSTELCYSNTMCIYYTLKDGKTLLRSYSLAAPKDCTDMRNPLLQFAAVFNSLPFVLARNTPAFEVTRANVATCSIEGTREATGLHEATNLSSEDAYEFYTTCILPDLADSSLGRESFGSLLEGPAAEAVETAADGDAFNYTPCYVEFTFRTADGGQTCEGFSIPLDAKRTVAYLEELGFDPYWEES